MRRREFITFIGGGAVWPLATRAQSTPPVIGFLHAASPDAIKNRLDAFRAGLKEGGYVEGRDVTIEYRWANGDYDRLPALADDLVNRRVTVLAAGTTVASVAAKRASSTIPMVFTGVGGDPVKLGLVASLSRPGGNMTGIAMLTIALGGKRLELLRGVAPKAMSIALLVNPSSPNVETTLKEMPDAARTIGRNLVIVKASNDMELESSFATIIQKGAGALMVDADPFFFSRRDQLVALAKRYALPAIYEFREFATIGGLMSYSPDAPDLYRQAGLYVTRILRGEQSADLPIMQPTKFEFIINLKTAKALGLEIPANILALADQVIE